MQGQKKCVRCNTLNDGNKMYCVKCGKYLPNSRTSVQKTLTVWEQGFSATQEEQKYFVICPECQMKHEVKNGNLPLACKRCGYFFQVGLDKIISEDESEMQVSPVVQPKVVNETSDEPSGPWGKRKTVSPKMRLIPLGMSGIKPASVRAEGEILGFDGTILQQIKTSHQLGITLSPTGWYLTILRGTPLYNGVPQNAGGQVRLEDGDLIFMDDVKIRVEIV